MIYIGNDNNITLKVGTETVTAAYMGTEQVYPNVVPPIDYSMMYFTTEAIDDTVIHLSENRTSFEVSKDNGQTWTTTGSYPGIFNLGLLAGEKAYWRCSQPANNGGTGSSPGEYGIAHMDGTYRFKVYGNIMSLFWEDRFEDKWFKTFLQGCNNACRCAESCHTGYRTIFMQQIVRGMFKPCQFTTIAINEFGTKLLWRYVQYLYKPCDTTGTSCYNIGK